MILSPSDFLPKERKGKIVRNPDALQLYPSSLRNLRITSTKLYVPITGTHFAAEDVLEPFMVPDQFINAEVLQTLWLITVETDNERV